MSTDRVDPLADLGFRRPGRLNDSVPDRARSLAIKELFVHRDESGEKTCEKCEL